MLSFLLDIFCWIVSTLFHGLRPKQHGTGGDAQELRRWSETMRPETMPHVI